MSEYTEPTPHTRYVVREVETMATDAGGVYRPIRARQRILQQWLVSRDAWSAAAGRPSLMGPDVVAGAWRDIPGVTE